MEKPSRQRIIAIYAKNPQKRRSRILYSIFKPFKALGSDGQHPFFYEKDIEKKNQVSNKKNNITNE